MSIPGFPEVRVYIAFTTPYSTLTAAFQEVTAYTLGFSTSRGRPNEMSLFEPGTCTIRLDNTDGRFDPDNSSGPYYGYIRPNRRVRITAVGSDNIEYMLFSGYANSWVRTWPGGADQSVTELAATDRFKLLARRNATGSTSEEFVADRMTAILDGGGSAIVPSIARSINADGFATRTVAGYAYNDVEVLQSLQDLALADGGQLFVDGEGVLVYQSVKYRQTGGNTRATTSQATFGNTATAIPIEDDVDPTVDDSLMANKVTVTDCNGTVQTAEDTTLRDMDGPLTLDLGSTLLLSTDAQDRVADQLALRKQPAPRYDSITLNVPTDAAARLQALKREISDRITVAIIPPGQTSGRARDQFIESIAHDVTLAGEPSWRTTFGVSATGSAAVTVTS
jgi:hypothetical protein